VVATSALRDARNSQAFLEWVRSATGWRVEIISGLEEARLIHLGLVSSRRVDASTALMIDLGGGSCELTVSGRGHIRDTVSLPLGAVRLTDEFLGHDPPRKGELKRLRGFIAREVDRISHRITSARVKNVIATSGTAAALASTASHLRKNTRSRQRAAVSSAEGTRIAKLLARLRDLEQFQGARYEILIGSLFARCGFAIEFITDTSKRNPEFFAHKDGERIGVEVKSRHRSGVLNRRGEFDKEAPAEIKEYLGILGTQIRLAEKIVGDLLDFARIKPPQLETVAVKQLVDDQLQRAGSLDGVTVKHDFPSDLPGVRVDRVQIGQVVLNLITNALQAMNGNGAVLTFRGRRAADGFVRLDVIDTGTGITPDEMARLFEPLFTTKARGIGLGLAVSKGLVQANGGVIAAESRPGAGTTMSVSLPTAGASGL